MKKDKISEDVQVDEISVNSDDAVSKEKPAKVTKVGAMLKEMRLQKGLKVVDISKKLCIRKCYLEAIEESNYKEVPAFPYGIGFIRSYANFLGLNGENIVELFKEETNTSSAKDIHVLEPQPEATMPGIQYLLVSLLAIAVIYAGWTFFNQNQTEESVSVTVPTDSTSVNHVSDGGMIVVEEFDFNSSTDSMGADKVSDENSQIVVSEDDYVENSQSSTEEVKSENGTSAENNKVDVQAEIAEQETVTETTKNIPDTGVFVEVLKETWIEVKDENKLYISKVLQSGDSYKVPEGKGKILSVGKYDGVNVYVNGVITNVVRPNKKTNISLDKFLKNNH